MGSNSYIESHFDEHHQIYEKGKFVPRSKLEGLDFNNPTQLSLLTILGAERKAIETHLRERRTRALHLDIA